MRAVEKFLVPSKDTQPSPLSTEVLGRIMCLYILERLLGKPSATDDFLRTGT